MRELGIWTQITKRSAIHFQPEIMLIGAEPNDDVEEIKREIINRV